MLVIKPFSRTKLSILPTSHFLWENSEPSTFLENFKNLTQKTQPRKHPEKTLIVGFLFHKNAWLHTTAYQTRNSPTDTFLEKLRKEFSPWKGYFPLSG